VAADDAAAPLTDEEPSEETRWDSPHRLFALADGVFAISMTLLALDVRIPDEVANTQAGYASAAQDFYKQFGIFIIAFMITGRFWLNNHAMMSGLRKVDAGVLERTVLFLAGICSLPVATTLLFRFGSAPEAVSFASVLLAVTSLLSARLGRYLADPSRGLSQVEPRTRARILLNSLYNSGIFLLAVPVAYLIPDSSFAPLVWLLLLLDVWFIRLVRRLRRR
jgi:uncharacterized membrane protein